MTPQISVEVGDRLLTLEQAFDLGFRTELTTRTSGWRTEHSLTVRFTGAAPTMARIRVDHSWPAVEPPFWLLPGLFYGPNRPDGCVRPFPSFRPGRVDPAEMVSDAWMFRTDRLATPVAFALARQGGLALFTPERSASGCSGLGFAYRDGTASLSACFPVAEAPVSYVGLPDPVPGLTEHKVWGPAEESVLTWTVFELDDRVEYASVLRELHGELSAGAELRPWVEPDEAARLAVEGLLRWHYRPDDAALIETAAFERQMDGTAAGDRVEMHVAWLSGIPTAAALLRHGRRVGNAAAVAAGIRVIDNICANPAPNGSFWGRWTADRGWTESWSHVPGGLHARTLAEATLFLLRAVQAEPQTHPSWVTAARANLALARAAQDETGNLGSLYLADTGAVLSRAGDAGMSWIAALCAAGSAEYLRVAVAAGHHYAASVRGLFISGAPEDVDLAPSSEDGYAALIAYWALYERTGDPQWLDLARQAADWMLTFRYSYNVTFDPHTLLGQYAFATTGGDQASPSNQHLHSYGLICTRELVLLSRAVGDAYYAERAADTFACFRQFVARTDGDFNARHGMISERYFQTWCFSPPGMLLNLSHAWCGGVLLIAVEDNRNLGELR